MRERFLLIAISTLIFIILVGCTPYTSNPNKNVAYFLTEDGELDTSREYIQRGRLIEIPIGIEDTGDKEVFVDTYSGKYPATVVDGILYYIGEIPDEDGVIIDIIEEFIEEFDLTLKDFEEVGDSYVLELPNENNIRGLMIHQRYGNSLPIRLDGDVYIGVIPKAQVSEDDVFVVTIWKGQSLYNND